jgi:hypothetical protein
MTSPETLNTKVVTNEFSFLLVTQMVSSDAQFDSYRLLNSGHGAELFSSAWEIWWRPEDQWRSSRKNQPDAGTETVREKR